MTRRDVALLAGVSPAVVSYVLNNGPRPVSTGARQRVLDAVKQLSYKPDGLARSLRFGRTNTLGLVVPDTSNPFFGELAHAIEDAAFARDFAVLVCNSAGESLRERAYISSLAERRVDGLILVSISEEQDLSDMTNLSIPVVAMDRSPTRAPISTIRSDNEHAAALGTKHLLEHGHHRIGFVAGPGSGISDERLQGWLSTLREAGVAKGPIARAPFSFSGGFDAAVEVLCGVDKPTAILVSSDVQAIGLLSRLNSMHLKVPNDVAVVAIDGSEIGGYVVPTLTSVAQSTVRMAREAVRHLIDNPTERIHALFENALIARESCGCLAPHRNGPGS